MRGAQTHIWNFRHVIHKHQTLQTWAFLTCVAFCPANADFDPVAHRASGGRTRTCFGTTNPQPMQQNSGETSLAHAKAPKQKHGQHTRVWGERPCVRHAHYKAQGHFCQASIGVLPEEWERTPERAALDLWRQNGLHKAWDLDAHRFQWRHSTPWGRRGSAPLHGRCHRCSCTSQPCEVDAGQDLRDFRTLLPFPPPACMSVHT